MDHGWNDDRRNSKYSEINLSHCNLVHSKSHMNWLGIEPKLKNEGRNLKRVFNLATSSA